MASIHLTEVTKTYGDEPAVDGLTFSVDHGEFLVLLGPSGCGKSTILRMLAGLVDVTAGEIAIDGHRVDQLTPKDRDLAFVFQNYALYPNLTVRKNIAFPLVMASMRWWQHLPGIGWWWRRRAERTPGIRDLVERTAATLELTPLLDRRPRTLSGGQRQRVALGRAMVRDPAAFLMDEPLSNLDAKLRTRTRAELVMLHERLGATFVYVTHDQVEAMTMGTVIAVLRDGRLQQFGTPKEIFQRPSNVFVARFIGSPPMNKIGRAHV